MWIDGLFVSLSRKSSTLSFAMCGRLRLVADLHSSCNPCLNQPLGVVTKPIWMASCWFVAIFDFFLVIHFQKLHCQNQCVCSPTYIDYKFEIFHWIWRQSSIFFIHRCNSRGHEVQWYLYWWIFLFVLGTATVYHNSFNSLFAGTWKCWPARSRIADSGLCSVHCTSFSFTLLPTGSAQCGTH